MVRERILQPLPRILNPLLTLPWAQRLSATFLPATAVASGNIGATSGFQNAILVRKHRSAVWATIPSPNRKYRAATCTF